MVTKNTLILTTSLGFGLSLFTLIMSCAFVNNWWPLFTFGLLPMMAIPFLFFSCMDPNKEGPSVVEAFGHCTSGFVLSTLFMFPIVLYHTGTVSSGGQFVGWIIANIILLLSFLPMFLSNYGVNLDDSGM